MRISKYLKAGSNAIELYCDFKQSEKIYADIRNAGKFESVRNKLTYDMEIENIYLVGDFSVRTSGEFGGLDKEAVRYVGEFCIDKPVKTIRLQNIEQQGFPFFSGRITVRKSFEISDVNKKLMLNMKGINAVDIKVNKKDVSIVIWNNSEIDLSPYLSEGENVVEFTLVNNLRNLLGPHHLQEGECYMVLPSSFIKGENFWNWTPGKLTEWNDGYCFVETSIN